MVRFSNFKYKSFWTTFRALFRASNSYKGVWWPIFELEIWEKAVFDWECWENLLEMRSLSRSIYGEAGVCDLETLQAGHETYSNLILPLSRDTVFKNGVLWRIKHILGNFPFLVAKIRV